MLSSARSAWSGDVQSASSAAAPDRWRTLKNPYALACAALILAWLGAWLAAFHNIYGWLTDDAMTFYRIQLYERGGPNVLDIQWFHAYMWFLITIPWLMHWAIPSHVIPRAWDQTPHFRALILYTIVLHAVLLAIVAYFFRALCDDALMCIAAFVLFMTSPTFLLYADLLDSRYLGLLPALPAVLILLSFYPSVRERATPRDLAIGFFLPGLGFAIGQAIHYTELYLVGPLSIVYWIAALSGDGWRTRAVWQKLAMFCTGLLAWIVPVQLVSLHYHPFADSMIGTILAQVNNHQSPYGHFADLSIWSGMFYDDMGLPMMIAVAAGAWVLWSDRLRPVYVQRFHARLMVAATVLASFYFLLSSAYPFYRQVSGLALFYAIFAVVAIERAVSLLHVWPSPARVAVGCALFIAVAFVPSIVRAPEVFVAQQGLGLAVNFADDAAGPDHVFFMPTYDWDPNPKSILSRRDFDRLTNADYIVTDYPIFYHVKYPDIFALMYETKPVAAFPTEWCTQETWAELREYFAFRKWFDEPSNCDAEVYRVADLRAAAKGKPLVVASVSADSSLSDTQGPSRVLAIRNPKLPLDDNYYGLSLYGDLWASQARPGPHWLQLTFARPETIGAITVVPPDFQAPPTFSYFTYSGRIATLRIYGAAAPTAPLRLLWSGDDLQDQVIFTATFLPASVQRLRFVVEQASQPRNQIAAIEFIRFPGYVVRTAPVASAPRGRSKTR